MRGPRPSWNGPPRVGATFQLFLRQAPRKAKLASTDCRQTTPSYSCCQSQILKFSSAQLPYSRLRSGRNKFRRLRRAQKFGLVYAVDSDSQTVVVPGRRLCEPDFERLPTCRTRGPDSLLAPCKWRKKDLLDTAESLVFRSNACSKPGICPSQRHP